MTPSWRTASCYSRGIARVLVVLPAALLLTCIAATPADAQALPHNIPDFTLDATKVTVRSIASGDWSSALTWTDGHVPTADDIVHVDPGHIVTISTTTAAGHTIAVHGTLRFSPSVDTRLTVTNLMVMGDHGMPSMTTVGHLEVGTETAPIDQAVTAEIIIANSPIGNGVADPEQFGTGLLNFGKMTMHGSIRTPTFLRLAAEPHAGDTTLTLSAPVTGWVVGDRVILPDTRHLEYDEVVPENPWVNASNQWEERTVAAISPDGRTLTIDSGLDYDHLGARDSNGVLDFLPHVGNLTRNVIIRSESATGTRGHTMSVHIADTDLRYVLFRDLGRTKYTPLNTTTNAIGRYPVHMHHNRGPVPAPANGHQFTLIGNAVDGGSVETQFKWGIAVHNSHYGLIQDNVVYNYNGAAIAAEDGSESFNLFDHNFVMRGMGEPDNEVDPARAAMGTEGVGFWFRGANNYVRNNVAANFQNPTPEASYGFVYQLRLLGNVAIPNFKGADPEVAGAFTTRHGNNMPLRQFENNEAYGAMQGGLTYWWIGSEDPQPFADAQESVIKDFRTWHVYNKAVYIYPGAKVTFDGLTIRGNHTSSSHCCGSAVHFSDYSSTAIVIRNSDIQGMATGIDAPSSGFGPGPNLLVEDSVLQNWTNISVPTPSSVNGCWMNDVLTVVSNTQLLAPPGRSLDAIAMGRAVGGAIECLSRRVGVRVYAYNGTPSDNFQLYHSTAAVLPRPPELCSPTTRSGIDGLVCAIAPLGVVPAVTLTASPLTIITGQSSTLNWTTTYATSVAISPGIGLVAAEGTLSVSPTTTTTYTLTATNAEGTTTATTTVTVNPPAPTATLSAVPATIVIGHSTTLSWTTTDATMVTINHGVGTVAASGTLSVSPSSSTTYTITATNVTGTGTATATVTVNPPAATAALSAVPATIVVGQSATLSWTTTNATSININHGVGIVAASGSMSVSPTTTTTYTITATNVTGAGTATATITVNPPAPTATLTVLPGTITSGQSATLSWTTTNAATVSIQGIGSVASSGSQSVSPTTTTTYTITATNVTGTATATASVTVNIAPLRKLSPGNGSGAQPPMVTLSWSSHPGAAAYEYCVDTIDNNACDTSWVGTGPATIVDVNGLPSQTEQYWQVRAQTTAGLVTADFGNWWRFTTATFRLAGLVHPIVGKALAGGGATFAWDAGVNITEFSLWVGLTRGGGEIYKRNESGLLRRVVSLPIDGRWIYVRLWSRSLGRWAYRDYEIQAALSDQAEPHVVPVRGDYDGDDKADFALWLGDAGRWYFAKSSTGNRDWVSISWGNTSHGDVPVPGDFDGDGKTDPAVWRPSDGAWYALKSSSNYSGWTFWHLGVAGRHQPVSGDFDGDRKTDPAVWDPVTGAWLILQSASSYQQRPAVQWGRAELGDRPVPADYDGDGKTDPAIWRAPSGDWYWLRSSTGYAQYAGTSWGREDLGDQPAPADYDGDGKIDPAVWRGYSGEWYWRRSSSGYTQYGNVAWGRQDLGDEPIADDYDGDGKADPAVWRARAGARYVRTSSTTYARWFGLPQ